MRKINLNDVARAVASAEGKKKEVNIAQIKEVMRNFLLILSTYNETQILELMRRVKDSDVVE